MNLFERIRRFISMDKHYVSYGSCPAGSCGASKDITGCRFSIYPMSDDFINIILSSISKVDTSKLWSKTDKLSTIYRGKRCHVLDALKACFIYSYRKDVHSTMEITLSKGCPGDTDAESHLADDDTLLNEGNISNVHFPVDSKIALYPMGVGNYMQYIADVVNKAIDLGIYDRSSHYATILKGDVQDLFSYFNWVAKYSEEHLSHYVFEITLSVNSPTAE